MRATDQFHRGLLGLVLLGIALGLGSGCHLLRPSTEAVVLPESIQRDISPYKTFDHRPYELIWSGRKEFRKPSISFSRLKEWSLHLPDGLSGALQRSTDQQLWGEYSGGLSLITEPNRYYAGHSIDVEASPPEKIALTDSFDSISFWIWFSDALAQSSLEKPLTLSLTIEQGSRGVESIPFELKGVGGWNFFQKKLPKVYETPLALEKIQLHFPQGLPQISEVLYFDSLNFYREPWNRLRSPKPPVGLSKAQRAEVFNFHPPEPHEKARIELRAAPDNALAFVSKVGDDELVYTVNPGGRQGVVLGATWNGFPLGDLLEGLGCSQNGEAPEVISSSRRADGLEVIYKNGTTLLLSLKHRSLSVEIHAAHRDIETFNLGRMQFASSARALSIPFYRLGLNRSLTVYRVQHVPEAKPIYIHVFFDPAYSGASTYVDAGAEVAANGSHGQLKYLKNTSGVRPFLKERIFITVSSSLQDVLPRVPHQSTSEEKPPVQSRLWRGTFSKRKKNEVADRCAQLSDAGMNRLLLAGSKACWSDGQDSFAYRSSAAPYQGGDPGLFDFVQRYKNLGMGVYLYTHLGDLSPLNGLWNENFIARASDGSFRRGCCNSYVLKNNEALKLSANQFEALSHKFDPSGFVVDMSCVSFPGETTDYDARIATSGSFAQPYMKNFEMLYALGDAAHERLALDASEWLYAGAVNGLKADSWAYTIHDLYPLNPVFSLWRINPITPLYGMGDFDHFFKLHPLEHASVEERLDRYLCTQVAYGLAGELVDLPRLSDTARSYFPMLKLQEWRNGLKPLQLAMHDGKRYKPFSEVCGLAEAQRGHLYIEYEQGLEVWVNASFDSDWQVRSGADTFLLPPAGWLAKSKHGLLFSGLHQGKRLDYLEDEQMIYMDARGESQHFRGTSTSGAVLLFKPSESDPVIGWGLGSETSVSLSKGHRFAARGKDLELPNKMPQEAIASGWPRHE